MNILHKYLSFIVVFMALQQNCFAQQFNIGTYNLRVAIKADSVNGNGWGQRYPVIANMVKYHGFDIFGTQEGLYHQLTNLKDSLPGYSFIGVGREDGKQQGEFSAVFYRTDKFQLLDSGNFWLSAITDRPNKGWDAAYPRICTWGKFKEKASGFTFYFFNLHMDHIGVQARSESAKLIFEKMKAMPPNTPVVLTGDFNINQNDNGYKLINESGILKDSYELSPIKLATTGTVNVFNTNLNLYSRIDHIFLSKEFRVVRYGILTDTYRTNDDLRQGENNSSTARAPSDHFPVLIEVDAQKKRK